MCTQELFVTKENPQLGFTNFVQHEVHLKQNFVLHTHSSSLKELFTL